MPSGFLLGVRCGLRGIGRCVTSPRLWPWSLAPALLTLVLFVLPWWALHGELDAAVRESLAGRLGEGWISTASGVLTVVVVLVSLVCAYLLFAPLARVVAAPFLAVLSDRTVRDVSGAEPPVAAAGRFARFVVVPVRDALVFLAIRAALTALLLPLLCVPFGALLFFAAMVPLEGLDRMDVAQSSRAVPLGRRIGFLRAHFGACVGLGTVAALLLLVPVANVLLLPGLVVGAVLLDREVSPDFAQSADGTVA